MKRRLLAFTALTLILVFTLYPTFAQEPESEYDGYEVITPDNIDRLTQIATYGRGVVGTVARWSPNGETLAVTGTPGVWLFDADDLDAAPELIDVGEIITDVEWSSDGRWLAFGNGNNHLYLQDFSTDQLTEIDGGVPFAFNPDATHLAYVHSTVVYSDPSMSGLWNSRLEFEVQVRDLQTGYVVQVYRQANNNTVNGLGDLTFSPDGETLYLEWSYGYGAECAGGGLSTGLFAWKGTEIESIEPTALYELTETQSIYGLAFYGGTPQPLVATTTASFESVLTISDWDTQTSLLTIPKGGIQGEPFSADGQSIAAEIGGQTGIFDLDASQVMNTQGTTDLEDDVPLPKTTIAYTGNTDFHPDGTRIAISNFVWDTATGERIDAALVNQFYSSSSGYLLEITPTDEVYTRDVITGDIVSSFAFDAPSISNVRLLESSVLITTRESESFLYDIFTGEMLTEPLDLGNSYSLTANGQLLLLPDGQGVLDTRTGQPVIPPDFERYISPTSTQDGLLIYEATDGHLRFWDFKTETLLPFTPIYSENIDVIFYDYSVDRFIILHDGSTGTALIWDRETNQQIQLENVTNARAITFDTRQMQLAYNHEKTIYVADLETGEIISSRTFDDMDYIDSLWFTRGVVEIHAACRLPVYWDYLTDEVMEEAEFEARPIRLAAEPIVPSYSSTSPDDQIGIYWGVNGYSLWKIADRTELPLPGEGSPFQAVSFTADGRFLIGRTASNQVMVWGVPE